ncbi:hypothetical protein GOP47_0008124 [Adiantum capillus-veneris]|uniref:Uncharacterized protein n=1 Tax=Adiantum capillus-veneris TaxID=13818 RepID=A0A9D4ZHW2_ADICA|nr:hypothetical protein GOP47_0008124 [Adiantum capillus-veneris]
MASLQQSMSRLSINGASQRPHTCAFSSTSLMGVGVAMPLSFSQVRDGRRRSVISMVVRRWERKEVKPNSLPVLQKLHVKTQQQSSCEGCKFENKTCQGQARGRIWPDNSGRGTNSQLQCDALLKERKGGQQGGAQSFRRWKKGKVPSKDW